jgi:hypothetical protein
MPAKATDKKPIEDEISLHRKGWVIQRIGWILMFAFLIAALLGLFGEGPLSSKNIKVGNIEIAYERFCRYEHGMKIKLQSNDENISTVSIPQDYLENFRVGEIVPEPQKQVASAGYVNFQFEGSDNKLISFYLTPLKRKTVEGLFRANAHSFTIKHTIYP